MRRRPVTTTTRRRSMLGWLVGCCCWRYCATLAYCPFTTNPQGVAASKVEGSKNTFSVFYYY